MMHKLKLKATGSTIQDLQIELDGVELKGVSKISLYFDARKDMRVNLELLLDETDIEVLTEIVMWNGPKCNKERKQLTKELKRHEKIRKQKRKAYWKRKGSKKKEKLRRLLGPLSFHNHVHSEAKRLLKIMQKPRTVWFIRRSTKDGHTKEQTVAQETSYGVSPKDKEFVEIRDSGVGVEVIDSAEKPPKPLTAKDMNNARRECELTKQELTDSAKESIKDYHFYTDASPEQIAETHKTTISVIKEVMNDFKTQGITH